MKGLKQLVLMGWLIASSLSGAELAIVGFNSQGELNWTGPTNDAVYRLETSQSVTGPWGRTFFWTNQDRTGFTYDLTNGTRAYVMPFWTNSFYQVVLANAPQTFRYTAFDDQGALLMTGVLSLVYYPEFGPWSGFIDFQRLSGGTNSFYDGMGYNSGRYDVRISAGDSNTIVRWPTNSYSNLGMELDGHLAAKFNGTRFTVTNFTGTWSIVGGFFAKPAGRFQAEPIPSASP